MLTPGVHDFVLYRGTTLRKTFIWQPGGVPANLTGYSGQAQFRTDLSSDVVSMTLTSVGGGIIFVPLTGSVTMFADPATVSTAFPTAALKEVIYYGLQLVDTLGDVLPFMEGKMTLTRVGIT